MHIHQPINVCSALLDEQCNNNHFICIFAFTLTPFILKMTERWKLRQKNQSLRALSWTLSTCSSSTRAFTSPECASILAASLTLTRREVCVCVCDKLFLHPQPLSKHQCVSASLLPFLPLHAHSPSCFHPSLILLFIHLK